MTSEGTVKLKSAHEVTETLNRLEALLRERGVLIFARIDFSGDAARAGLAMRAEQQLIFGNPKAGTPLMQANPAAALDLPIRAVAWADESGTCWLAYNDPAYVVKRHGLDPALAKNLSAVVPLIEQAVA
jgi:uncharacterized protein (DUF302 family)